MYSVLFIERFYVLLQDPLDTPHIPLHYMEMCFIWTFDANLSPDSVMAFVNEMIFMNATVNSHIHSATI